MQRMVDAEVFDVIVVGGGASGMMAACTAAARGRRVLLLEKNAELGEKLKITGGGRCNITNAQFDTQILLNNYGEAAKFLHSPFAQFGVQETFDFFTSRGLPLVVEERNRAFPHTHSAPDVCAVLVQELKTQGVTVRTRVRVQKLLVEDGRVCGVWANTTEYRAESVILATGGLSHPETGSTGDGFTWLADVGQNVQQPTPTIVPLAVSNAWVHNLAGVTLENVRVSFLSNGTKAFHVQGNVLATHFGLSGPSILNSAGKVADLLQSGPVTAHLDLFPHMDEGTLSTYLVNTFDEHKNKELKNVLRFIVPTQLVDHVLGMAGIAPNTPVHSITKDQRKACVKTLKLLPMDVTGLMGFDRAVVADGGLELTDIDMREMRSKRYPSLFVTGDLLNIRRPSGGFSLQLCWTTGFVAGSHA